MELVKFSQFKQEYYQNLRGPSCIPPALEDLCSGWTQEAVKQIHQKITKKNTVPIVLWFDKWQSMESISIKKAALQKTFDLYNTRNLDRIDSLELFSVILFLAKGDFEKVIQNITIFFGWKKPNHIHPEELFFFLDCFFRGISKALIKQGDLTPRGVNKRLQSTCIKGFIENLFQKSEESVLNENLPELLTKDQDLYQFLKYIHQQLQASNEYAREEYTKMLKIQTEIKRVMLYLITETEKKCKINQ